MKQLSFILLFLILSVGTNAQVADTTLEKVKSASSIHSKTRILINDGWKVQATDPKSALEYVFLAQKDSQEIKSPLLLDSLYRLRAFCYGDLNNRSATLKSHLARLRVLNKMNKPTKALSSAYYESAALIKNQGNDEMALAYYLKCYDVAKLVGYDTQLGQVMMTLSDYYKEKNQLDSALLMLNDSRKIFEPIERLQFILGSIDIQIATLNDIMGNQEAVIGLIERGLKYADTLNYPDYNAITYSNAGGLLLKYGKVKMSIKNLHIAESICLKHNKYFYLPKVYRSLSSAYTNTNKTLALEYLNKYVEINDSVLNVKNNEAIAELQFIYEDEKKGLEIANLQKDNLLVEAESSRKSEQLRLIVVAFIVVVVLMVFLGFLVKKVRNQNQLVREQKKVVEVRNQEVEDSINYAQRIQEAMIPQQKRMEELFPMSFVYYSPKENLSGDFYWCYKVNTSENENLNLFAVGDCTGHGIPGALLSILGINYLNLGAVSSSVNSTGEALDYLDFGFQHTFGHSRELIRDGMDIVLGAIDLTKNILHYSCAKNPIYIVRKKELIILKGDKKAVGNDDKDHNFRFSVNSFDLLEGDKIYAVSDGFQDQFGGPSGKKYKLGNFKKFLIDLSSHNMDKQRVRVENELNNWKGNLEQIDDVTIMGIGI